MNSLRRFSLTVACLAVLGLAQAVSLPLPASLDPPFDPKTASFVTREGSRLLLDGQEYRFLSVNIPNYHIVEDPAYEGDVAWHRVTAFEQTDAARAVRLLGGRVFRIYVPSVQGGKSVPEGQAHVQKGAGGKVEYNEALFRDLDRGLAIAASQGVRVILPLVDNWDSFGGHREWARLAGVYDFWDKAKSRAEFKRFLGWLTNRVNTVSGVKYKDDPTILAWELGNEIRLSTPEWVAEISAALKELDPRHLIMDGGYSWVRSDNVRNPNIDILTTHYTNDLLPGFIDDAVSGGKVFVYGEYEPKNAGEVEAVARMIAGSPAAGALIWSLRFHAEAGGFYFHGDFGHSDSLQYPGLAQTGPVDEPALMAALKTWAWYIRGFAAPADPIPEPPTLLPAPRGVGLAWRGSTGATSYDLERAVSADGPWEAVAAGLPDARVIRDVMSYYTEQPQWKAGDADRGRWYRLFAVNQSGRSAASESFYWAKP